MSHRKRRPVVTNILSNDIYFGCTPYSFPTQFSSPTQFPSFISLASFSTPLVIFPLRFTSFSFLLIPRFASVLLLFLVSRHPFFFVSPHSLLPPILGHKEKENGKREIGEE